MLFGVVRLPEHKRFACLVFVCRLNFGPLDVNQLSVELSLVVRHLPLGYITENRSVRMNKKERSGYNFFYSFVGNH
jgi:hypothetical protein